MSKMNKKFFGTVSGVASVALASSSLTFANPPKQSDQIKDSLQKRNTRGNTNYRDKRDRNFIPNHNLSISSSKVYNKGEYSNLSQQLQNNNNIYNDRLSISNVAIATVGIISAVVIGVIVVSRGNISHLFHR